VLPQWQRRGIASGALKTVIAIADGPVFANINPANRKSQSMFAKLGFVLVQHTYKLDK
jgi:RimJ/RimL family protein N-acetyltransferase